MFPRNMICHAPFLAALLCAGLMMAAPESRAGFEWTPPAGAPAPAATEQKPPMAAQPEESMTLEPVQSAPMPTPNMIEREPLESDPPPGLRVKTVAPVAPVPDDQPDMQKAKAMIEAQKLEENMKAPPQPAVQPAPAPEKMAMPEAKPVSAPIDTPTADPKTATSGRLVINPYPLGNAPRDVPPEAALAQPEMPAEYSEAVGFGSDMPLALALRQVVPPQYAFSFGEGVNPGYRVSWNGGRPWDQVVREMVAPLNLQAEVRGKTVVIFPAGKMSALPPSINPPKATVISMNGEDLSPNQPRRHMVVDPGPQTGEQPQELGRIAVTDMERIERAAQNAEGVRIAIPVETPQAESQPRIWEAKEGASLKDTLDQWSTMANVDMVWKASHDYQLASNVMVNGTYSNAVKVLMTHSISDTDKPKFDILSNGDATTGIVIEDAAS